MVVVELREQLRLRERGGKDDRHVEKVVWDRCQKWMRDMWQESK